jgi:hypothetical protein
VVRVVVIINARDGDIDKGEKAIVTSDENAARRRSGRNFIVDEILFLTSKWSLHYCQTLERERERR